MGYENGRLTGTLLEAGASKTKSRMVWNIILSIFLLIALAFFGWLYLHFVFDGLFTFKSTQEYVKYEDGSVYTDAGKLKLCEDNAKIELSVFLSSAEPGDALELSVSKISGGVKEIRKGENVLYAENAVWWMPFFLLLPLAVLSIGIFILALISINLKNPKGFFKKFPIER